MRKLLKASITTGAGTAAALIFGAVTAKIISVLLGPGGLGVFSLVRQTYWTAVTVGSLSGQTAIVQGVSSREGPTQQGFTLTVLSLYLLAASSAALLMVVFAPGVGRAIFSDELGANGMPVDSAAVLRWLAAPVFAGALLNFALGVLNAHRAIGMMAFVRGVSAAAMAALALPMALAAADGSTYAFPALLGVPAALVLILALRYAHRRRWLLFPPHSQPRFDMGAARHFLSVATTSLVTGLAFTGSVLGIRAVTARQLGLATAGLFEVAWTLGMTYITLVLSSLVTYYLPTLTRTKDPGERATLIRQVLRFTIVTMTPLLVLAVTIKPLVVAVLYSQSFHGALGLLRWMFIGDFMHATTWVLGLTAIAYADLRVAIWCGVLWPLTLLFGSVALILTQQSFEVVGPVFLVVQAGYLVFLIRYVRARNHFLLDRKIALNWLAGLAVVAGASWYTWSELEIDWTAAGLWLLVAAIFSWHSLEPRERKKLSRYLLGPLSKGA